MFFSSGLHSLSLTYESQAGPLCFTHHATKALPVSCLSTGKAEAPGPTQFPLVWSSWSADEFHPDSKHSSASSVFQYFPLPKDPQCHARFSGTSPQWPLCSCRLGLGQCGCTLPRRGCSVTRHLKGPENGTCHASVTASPVQHVVHFVDDRGTVFHWYVKTLQRVQK